MLEVGSVPLPLRLHSGQVPYREGAVPASQDLQEGLGARGPRKDDQLRALRTASGPQEGPLYGVPLCA